MNESILRVLDFEVTPWKLIGYAGALLFAGRWLVQVLASRRSGRPVVPRAFWYMGVAGSVLLLCYFVFGSGDSVGIVSNVFPLGIGAYNLFLDVRSRRDPHFEQADKF